MYIYINNTSVIDVIKRNSKKKEKFPPEREQ